MNVLKLLFVSDIYLNILGTFLYFLNDYSSYIYNYIILLIM